MKRILCSPYIIFMCCILLVSCASPKEKRDAFLKKGKELEEQHDYVRARLEYKNAVKVDSECIECYERLAKVNMALRDLKGAYRSYARAAELAPERGDLQLAVARLLLIGRAPEQAEQKLRVLLSKEPDNWEAKLLLASALSGNQEKRQEALTILDEYRAKFPNNPKGYLIAANIYSGQGRADQAVSLLKDGLNKCQEKKGLLKGLFALYERQHKLDDALKVAEKLSLLYPDDPANDLALARIHEQMKEFDKAGKDWETALQKSKNNPSLRLAYAQYLLRTTKVEEARKVLQQGLKDKPESLELRIGLAELLTKTGKPEDALKIIREANQEDLSPAKKIALKNSEAKVLLAMKKVDDALATVEEILKENLKDAQALLLKARIAMMKKDGETAIASLRQLVDDSPNNVEYRLLLARAHILNKEMKLAEDQLRQATQVAPKHIGAWIDLARLQSSQDDLEAAINTMASAMKENPRSARLAYFYGILKWKAKDFKRAEKYLKKAIELNPSWLEPYRGLAALYANSANKQKAEESLKKAVADHPNAGNLKILLAAFYEQIGETVKAIKIYEDLLKQVPDHPIVCNNLAYLYAENSTDPAMLKRATELVDRAAAKLPGQATILDTRAWILYKSGRLEDALAILEKALSKAEIPTLLYHKAVILAGLNRKDEAKEILTGLVSGKKNFPEKEKANKLLATL